MFGKDSVQVRPDGSNKDAHLKPRSLESDDDLHGGSSHKGPIQNSSTIVNEGSVSKGDLESGVGASRKDNAEHLQWGGQDDRALGFEARAKEIEMHIKSPEAAEMYRRRNNPLSMFYQAKEYVLNGGNSGRYTRAKERFEFEMLRQGDIEDYIVLYVAGEDITFLEGATKDEIYRALLRREAWKQKPYTMVGIIVSQMVLCIICMVSANENINLSTVLMTAIFLVATGMSNPFDVTHDLFKALKKRKEKINNEIFRRLSGDEESKRERAQKYTNLVWLALTPVAILVAPIVLLYTILFDLMVGRFNDITWVNCVNIAVQTIVVCTALSIGCRSGNCINAIQTFSGFDFISMMDEAVINTVKFDPYSDFQVIHRKSGKTDKKKGLIRAFIYVFVPSFILFTGYITFTNACYVFCQNLSSLGNRHFATTV